MKNAMNTNQTEFIAKAKAYRSAKGCSLRAAHDAVTNGKDAPVKPEEVLLELVRASNRWRANQDSPKLALDNFERVAELARKTIKT